jgi:hypothetical protein
MSNDNNRKVMVLPYSSHNIAKDVTKYLAGCFSKKKPTVIMNDLLRNKYDMFYMVDREMNVLGILSTKPDMIKNEVYITNVCKITSSGAGKGVFEELFKKVKKYYETKKKSYLNNLKRTHQNVNTVLQGNIRYYLQVNEDNRFVIKLFKSHGFRKRHNLGFKLSKNKNAYLVTMNTTKIPDTLKIAKNFHVGQNFENTIDIITLRRALLDVTTKRWIQHKLRWQNKRIKERHMHMIYGNLAITMFITINQYLSTGIKGWQIQVEEIGSFPEIPNQNLSRIGANYAQNGRHVKNNNTTFTTLDIFRSGVYDLSFTELKKLARTRFDEMYEPIKKKIVAKIVRDRSTNNLSPKVILNIINTNFKGRNEKNGLTFFGHNMGMYQYLAMLGLFQNGNGEKELKAYTGNCTMIALFKIAFYVKIIDDFELRGMEQFNTHIQLLSQAKYVQNSGPEVCHYGLRAKGMNIKERFNGGDFQRQTYESYGYIETASVINDFTRMYDVLTANAVYRAKHRAGRNQGDNFTRSDALNELTNRLTPHMDPETLLLHGHRLSTRVSYNIPENISS